VRIFGLTFFFFFTRFFLFFSASKQTQINLLLMLLFSLDLAAGLAGEGIDLPKAEREGEASR